MAAAPEQGAPLSPPEPGVYEIVLPITVFELSDEEFLESEEQPALKENSFCLTSGKSEIVKEGRGVEGVDEDHLNDGTLTGKHREKQATPVTKNDGCDEDVPDIREDLNVVSFQNALDHSEPDQNRAMGFLDPVVETRPEKEDAKITDFRGDHSCDQRTLTSLNTQNKGESNVTDSVIKMAAAVSQGTDPVANKFVPGSVNYEGTDPLETGYNKSCKSPRKGSELSEETCQSNKSEEYPNVDENGQGASPFINGNCLPGDFPEDAESLTMEHRTNPEPAVAGKLVLPEVTDYQERHDTQENTNDSNENAESDQQSLINVKEAVLVGNKPINGTNPDVAEKLVLSGVTDCQERHDTQENTNDSNKNAESDQRLLMNVKEAVLVGNKPINGTHPEPDVAGKLVLPGVTDCQERHDMQENTNDSNKNAESDQRSLMNVKEVGLVGNKSHNNTSMEKHAKTTDCWKCFLCDFEGTSSARLEKHIRTVHKNKHNHQIIQRSSFVSSERCHKFIKKKKALKKGRSGRCDSGEDRQDKDKPAAERKKQSMYEKFFSRTKVPKPSKRFRCKICSSVFSDPKDFSQHMKEHNNVLPYQCPQCDYASDDHSYFQNHVYWHAGYELYQCNFCKFLSRHFNSMVKHSYLHTGAKPFWCTVCQLGFTSTSGLNRHTGTHSKERVAQEKDARPPNTYLCDDCGIVFYTQALFESHKKYHLQGKGRDAPSVHLQKCKTQGAVCKQADGSQEGKTNSPNNLAGGKPDCFRRTYSCDRCSLVFHKEEHLVYHKAVHLQGQPRKNAACDARRSRRGVGSPEAQLTGRPALKLFKCLQCAYVTPSFSNLRAHFATHTGEKPFKCPECGKSFRNASHVKRHSLLHVRNRHRCSRCLFIGSTEEDLKRHEETCEDKGPAGKRPCRSALRCESSGGQTKKQTNQRTLSQGSSAYSYKCEHCTYRTYASDILKIHTRIHTGEKPYACDVCQKKFRTSSHLRRHTLVHRELEFSCSNCDYSAGTWLSFKQHLASHGKGHLSHGSQHQDMPLLPVKIHKCEKCSYSTIRKENLKIHFRIHTGERPYKCPHCGHTFRTSSHLKKHLPTHLKLQCDKCKFSTLDKHALQKHAQTHKKKKRSDQEHSFRQKVYRCRKCRLSFSMLRLFNAHKKKHGELGK